jgi:hypothetical protein
MELLFCIFSLLNPVIELLFDLTGGIIHTPCGTIRLFLDDFSRQETPEITYVAQWYLLTF